MTSLRTPITASACFLSSPFSCSRATTRYLSNAGTAAGPPPPPPPAAAGPAATWRTPAGRRGRGRRGREPRGEKGRRRKGRGGGGGGRATSDSERTARVTVDLPAISVNNNARKRTSADFQCPASALGLDFRKNAEVRFFGAPRARILSSPSSESGGSIAGCLETEKERARCVRNSVRKRALKKAGLDPPWRAGSNELCHHDRSLNLRATWSAE